MRSFFELEKTIISVGEHAALISQITCAENILAMMTVKFRVLIAVVVDAFRSLYGAILLRFRFVYVRAKL